MTPVNRVNTTRIVSNQTIRFPKYGNWEQGTGNEGQREGEQTRPDAAFPVPRSLFPASLLVVHLQYRQEGFLRNLHAADLLHPLLALFLFLEELLFAADVATITFGQHVLAHGLDRA